MKTILVVDYSLYRDALVNMFNSTEYNVISCESAFDAISKLKANDIDLVISEVELPGDNAFHLYNYIQEHYPYIPTIMTTEKNIDSFFHNIFKEGIGNILCKPVNKNEMLNLAEKLTAQKKIFGLQHYLKDTLELKKVRINSSKKINPAIRAILDTIASWGFEIENRMALTLVLNEMAINAIYHSHGLTKEKEARIPVVLDEGQYVDLFFGRNETGYGISIADYNGKLTKMRILDSIKSVIEQNSHLERAMETGEDVSSLISETGRGIDLVRKLAAEYYFIIRENVKTEIMLIFDHIIADDYHSFSSMKIIEDKG